MIYLAIPNSGTIDHGLIAATHMSSQNHSVQVCPRSNSCLAHNFNMSWCHALNLRKEKSITHFAMLHSDVVPEPWWLDTLMDELERTGADVVSCVVPIKDDRGLTSSGIGSLDTWDVYRSTMTEVHALPETYSLTMMGGDPYKNYLAANVGCWVCRWDGSWEEKFSRRGGFRVLTTIVQHADGNYRASFFPDDWDFSRWGHLNGLKVMNTRKVKLSHNGNIAYRNDFAWGQETEIEEQAGIRFESHQ